MLRGTTFWITGATGRLGCEAAARLEGLGAEIVPLVLPGYPEVPRRVPWPAKAKPFPALRPSDLEGLPRPDYVLNFHWRVDRGKPVAEQLRDEIEVNVVRPAYVWDWLRLHPCRAFLHVSSIKIFSHLNDDPVTAGSAPRPITAYGLAKAASEGWFDMVFGETPTALMHLRLGSVASVGEHPSQLMRRLYRSAFEDLPIRINAGHQARLFYIDEAVDLLIAASLSARSGRYNLAAAGIPNEAIARRFEALSGLTLNAELADLEPGRRDIDLVSDAGLWAAPWVRRMSLDEMIRAIIDGYSRPGSGGTP